MKGNEYSMSENEKNCCIEKGPLTEELLEKMNAWFRAANYLSAGQLYLLENPLLKKPLTIDMVKKKIVGHWGTVPGQNFVYVHLNRVIKRYDLDMILLSGPGHGGNFFIANTYMEGSYSEVYPNISEDEAGMQKLFKQFSFPGGVPSHCAPETPGSINEGGELGYSIAHAFGAVFDNPDLIAAVTVGDGEAETGPLATSWQSNKFLNPVSDGAVLPILHLNGYKIANPTIFARMSHQEITDFFHGCGWEPYFVEGEDPMAMHRLMAETMDQVIEKIKAIQENARANHDSTRPVWPVIILRTPKGWTGPKFVDGERVEGYWRAHQVPIMMDKPEEHLKVLEEWLRSYHAEELFDEKGRLIPELKALAPVGDARLGANPHANGGKLLRDLRMPDFRDYAVEVTEHGGKDGQDMTELGKFIRDIFALNEEAKNFRIFGPDETTSNRLGAVFEVENRDWNAETLEIDDHLAPNGRVMDSMLSEHMCEGWLEGYLLTGRHGFFATYEAFARIIDSMAAQHAKWLKVCNQLPWREEIASLNLIMASTVWQQDHNGFTHQEPDVVFACAGETPTLEALAAVSILHEELPDVKVRFINVVDLFKLQPHNEHPHGLSDADYDLLFTTDKPVIFAFHGYPSLVHELTYRRHNNRLMHVRGYKEEGTITTPFDVRVQNDIDRFHLVIEALRHLPQLGNRGAYLYQKMRNKLVQHKQFIHEYGVDLPEVSGWKWER